MTELSALLELADRAACPAFAAIFRLDCLVRHLLAGDAGRVTAGRSTRPGGEVADPRATAGPPAVDQQDLAPVDLPSPPGSADAGGSADAAGGVWSRLLALGFTGDELVIDAGIGRLRITPSLVEWQPVQPRSTSPPPTPLPALEAVRTEREAICRACSRYDGRCTLAGCGCAGLGNPAAALSKCPLGLWPVAVGST